MWILEFENHHFGEHYDELHKVWELATRTVYKNQEKALQSMKRQQNRYRGIKFRIMEIVYK